MHTRHTWNTRWMKSFVAGLLGLWITVQPIRSVLAQADPATCEEADRLVKEGLKKRATLEDKDALALFRRAHELCPKPRYLAQLGLAEQALGLWILAESHLAEALTATDDAWIDKHRPDLNGALEAVGGHLGYLEVELEAGSAKEAELLLDGRPVGALPLVAPLRVVAGTVAVEVRAKGFIPVMRPVLVPKGGRARERIVLVALAAPPVSQAQPATRLGLWRKLGIIGVAVGGAALGGGVAAQGVREQNARAFNADPACSGSGGEYPSICQDRFTRIIHAERWAVAGYVVGGTLAAGGFVLLALPARLFTKERVHAVTVLPGPGQLGLSLGAPF